MLEVKLIDENFFIFAVNKSIISDCENTFTCESGRTVKYEYVINPKDVPVYRYAEKSYDRELIYLDGNSLSEEGFDYEMLPASGNLQKRIQSFFKKKICFCI